MNELIKVNVGASGIKTVSARDLHEFLGSKRQFANWITERISNFGFTEKQDFTVNKFVIGRATVIDYHLTINMAKELAMVENNSKGKQARLYFLECERVAQQPVIDLSDPEVLLALLTDNTQKLVKANKVIEEQAPQVAALKLISASEGSLCLTDTAKELGILPHKTLFTWLHANGWVYKRLGTDWIATAEYLKKGYLEQKTVEYTSSDGSHKSKTQCRVTPKGLTKLAEIHAC